MIERLRHLVPAVNVNADPVPGSAGSDSPLYGEGGDISLGEAMKRAANQLQEKP